MKKSALVIVLLLLALVGSNGWWAYRLLDAGVSYTYQGVTLEENHQALAQALAVIKAMAAQGASRPHVVAAAQRVCPSLEPFEKDGYLWVGRLGLRFDAADQLIEAVPGF